MSEFPNPDPEVPVMDVKNIHAIAEQVAVATAAKVTQNIQNVADEAAQKAVRHTLLTLGIDIDNPREYQADMMHVRGWRNATETVKRQGLVVSVSVLVAGAAGLIWNAIGNPK